MTGPPFRPDDGVRHVRALRDASTIPFARARVHCAARRTVATAAEALNVPFAQNKLRPVDGGENRMLVDEESGRAQ